VGGDDHRDQGDQNDAIELAPLRVAVACYVGVSDRYEPPQAEQHHDDDCAEAERGVSEPGAEHDRALAHGIGDDADDDQRRCEEDRGQATVAGVELAESGPEEGQ
jgi:hypothetical protein